MAKTRMRLMRLTCSIVIILGLFAFLITDAGAKTNFARKSNKPATEESAEPVMPAAETKVEQCTDSPACCPPPGSSLPRRTGGPISHILAFGCKLNYCLTNWALSDKCDIGHAPQNCP